MPSTTVTGTAATYRGVLGSHPPKRRPSVCDILAMARKLDPESVVKDKNDIQIKRLNGIVVVYSASKKSYSVAHERAIDVYRNLGYEAIYLEAKHECSTRLEAWDLSDVRKKNIVFWYSYPFRPDEAESYEIKMEQRFRERYPTLFTHLDRQDFTFSCRFRASGPTRLIVY